MESFWAGVINNSLVVCVFALAALALGRFWKNPAAMHLVWVAVLLKLFVPPLYFLPVPGTAQLGVRQVETLATAPAAADVGGKGPSVAADRAPSPSPTINQQRPTTSKPIADLSAEHAQSWSLPSISNIGLAIWLCGVLIVGGGYAWRMLRFQRLLGAAQPASADLIEMTRVAGRKLGLRRLPAVYTIAAPLPPLVWSIVGRPRVILPQELLTRLSRGAIETIISHELAHVKRRDHWVRWLELAATTCFWWHPVVWFGRTRMREFEEQCCDARVIGAAPHLARDYAAALVDVLEFLSHGSPRIVPLPTAVSTGAITRRILMLRQAGTHRLSAGSLLLVAAIVGVPLTIALAAEEPQAQPAIVSGRVTDESGKPLAGARVVVAIPAADMRFVYTGTGHKTQETLTDEAGDYRLELAGITKPTQVSLNAIKPGYATLAGTLMSGGDDREFEVSPGSTSTQTVSLPAALYVRGTIVDEHGKPVAGVKVNANLAFMRASGGIQLTRTGEDGTFEIFNYAVEPDPRLGDAIGLIHLMHPDYIYQRLEDVYQFTPQQREDMRIVLDAGHHVSGRVLDASGAPVAGVMVEASSQHDRKAVSTDAQGRFNVRGLIGGDTEIRAHDTRLQQKIKTRLDLDRDHDDFNLTLAPIVMTEPAKVVKVLGMQLADVNPELKEAYDLYHSQGAVILDPGKDFARLKIGNLSPGFCFWMAGNQRVTSLRDFLQRILDEYQDEKVKMYGCRVVYTFADLESKGTNTQHMQLTADDLREIAKVVAELKEE